MISFCSLMTGEVNEKYVYDVCDNTQT